MKKALIGFGGHAREVMAQMNEKLTCFVEDDFLTAGTRKLSELDTSEYEVMIAIGDSKIRKKLLNKLPQDTQFFSWIHPTSLVLDNVVLGEGSFVGAYSIITTNVKIGNHCILNRHNQIGHDCVIGDFFSAMPGSIVSGNVTIGDSVYLGNNCSIKQNLSITSEVTIGMNSAVVKNITLPGTYVGVPTKKL